MEYSPYFTRNLKSNPNELTKGMFTPCKYPFKELLKKSSEDEND